MDKLEWRHISGNTWCLDGHLTIPVYFLNRENVVLLDSGYADRDRANILTLLTEKKVRVRAVIGSHSHNDHSGNFALFQKTQGAEIILRDIEAAIVSDYGTMTLAYRPGTPAEMAREFQHLLLQADRTFRSEDTNVTVDGAVFGLVPLPGHTPGHTGIVTPDHVFYVGDAVLDKRTILNAKLPSTIDWAVDLESKRYLKQMRYPWYVLAHRGVYATISELVDHDIAERRNRTEQILEWLAEFDEVTLNDVEQLLWARLGLHSKTTASQIVFRRNASCALEFLVDTGKVQKCFRDGTCWYRASIR